MADSFSENGVIIPENIEVADDNTIQKILRECISTLNLNHEDYDA